MLTTANKNNLFSLHKILCVHYNAVKTKYHPLTYDMIVSQYYSNV